MTRKKEERELPADYADAPFRHSGSMEDFIHVPGGPGIVTQAQRDHERIEYLTRLHAKRDAVQGKMDESELDAHLDDYVGQDFDEFYYSDTGREYTLNKLEEDGRKIEAQRRGKTKSHEEIFASPQQRRLMDEQRWIDGSEDETEE